MPANTAAWLTAKQTAFEVNSAPYTAARDNEIVVRNHAVAVNPVDWIKQTAGDFLFSWIRYPFILGSDLAGEIVEVGKAVTRFKVGDRVLAHAVGTDPKRNSAAEGSFQAYTVVLENMASAIPDDMPYERAAVLPLGLSTAACGLFEKDQLALEYPSLPPKPNGKTLLVWGGSTSVGSNAIQLAVAAGYDVVTTASPRNFDYVKKLGASVAFDYASKSVVRDVIGALEGKTIAGALAVGANSGQACIDVVRACKGRKFVSMATFPMTFGKQFEGRGPNLALAATIANFVRVNATMWVTSRTRGVGTKYIFGSSLAHNEVGKLIYADFLPKALAEKSFVAAPDPHVIGKGLEYAQAGLDLQKKGVSASKIVILL